MAETKVTKTRKKLSLAEQKAKLAAEKLKIAALEAKIAVDDLKDYINNLKIASVTDLFSQVKAGKAGVKDIDILRTIADIAKLKVIITDKPKVSRTKKAVTKAKAK